MLMSKLVSSQVESIIAISIIAIISIIEMVA